MEKTKIDKALIEKIKSNQGNDIPYFINDLLNHKIVPSELRHDNLYTPSYKIISDFYFSPFKILGLEPEYHSICGYRPPYLLTPSGAFIRIDELVYILEMIVDYFPEINDYQYLEDLYPFFDSYAEGFDSGFNTFREKKVAPRLENTNQLDVEDVVFDFIKSSWKPKKYSRGYTTVRDAGHYLGILAGYDYRAWSFILLNEKLYEPLFKENKEQFFNDIEIKYELQIKLKAKHYAWSFLLDCKVLDKDYWKIDQKNLEKILEKRANGKLSGNTIRKSFDKIKNEENIFHEDFLIENIGENWRDIMLDLSGCSSELDMYLKTKQL